jgi:predicted Rossmann fold flavoprotein
MAKNWDVIIIGAGAAGLLAAGRAAECGAKVAILEKMNKPGRKLMITGNGRCNITNSAALSEFLKHIGPDSRFVRPAFSEFFSKDIINLLEKHDVQTVVEDDEFVFTKSNKATDVVNALIEWNKGLGVEIYCNSPVTEIVKKNNIVEFILTEGDIPYYAKSIVVACGGASYPTTGSSGDGYKWFKSLGHKITSIRPALVPLVTKGVTAQRLQGLTLPKTKIVVWVDGKKKKEQRGDLLFTHFGISGPLVHSLSRYIIDDIQIGRKVVFAIDLLPEVPDNNADEYLLNLLNKHCKKLFENILALLLPPKLIPICFEATEISTGKTANQVNAKERKRLRLWLKEFKLEITGSRSFAKAMITSGGVYLNEIDSKSMQSRLIKNLFIAGEILNLDADTGGYNLQIAFSTGYIAGENAAKYAKDNFK